MLNQVQGILIGVVSAFVLLVTVFGPECVSPGSLYPRLLLMLYRNHGSHFENAKTAFEEGGGRDELAEAPEISTERRDQHPEEKNVDDQVEKV